jgi:hypothetical protein
MKPFYFLSSLLMLTCIDCKAEESEEWASEPPYYEDDVPYTSQGQQSVSQMQEDSDELSSGPSYEDNLPYTSQEQNGQSMRQMREESYQQPSAECVSPLHMGRIGIRHNEANGIGYKDGYTTVEGFAIFDQIGYGFMPFIDLRGHVFNNGKVAGNIGIGERSVIPGIGHIFGAYVYYDVRDDKHLTVNQLSPGIELLSKRMEYRINGYFPVGNHISRKYGWEFDRFKGHRILLESKQKRGLTGGDAEVGVHLTQSSTYDVFAGAGPYYFSNKATSWGGKARVYGRYKDYVSVEVSYAYDDLFHSTVQGSVALTLPIGPKLKRKGKGCPQTNDLLLSRATFAPSRMEIPVIKKVKRKEVAINPETGLPWNVWFVNNTSSSNGTFESPFPTLLLAQNASGPNDIIYVFPGDGSSTGMNAGITLQTNQRFYGSATAHTIPTNKGSITIPSMSYVLPSVTNSGSSVVVLASNNEISGFNLFTSTSGGNIVLGASGINGANINNNILFGVGTNNFIGINITGHGEININYNNITASSPVASSEGVRLTVDSALTMSGGITDNFISGFQFGCGVNVSGTSSTNEYSISGNTIQLCGTSAIFWGAAGVNSTGVISRNFLSNNSGVGINPAFATFGTSSTHLTINSNQILGSSTSPGMSITNFGSLLNNCYTIFNNTITQGSVSQGGILAGTNGGSSPTLCFDINRNVSQFGYVIVNNQGTILLEPIEGRNIGPVTLQQVAPITMVPPGTCCE